MAVLDFEAVYRKKGNTFLADLLGSDPFDFWAGRYYVGIFGVIAVVAIVLGVGVLFLGVALNGDGDLLRATVISPLPKYGLGWAPFREGGAWQLTIFFAAISFIAWALREVEICRKLEMGYHVPIMFSFAISAFLVLEVLRPILLGHWSEGFDLGFTGHLTWVSNTGFKYMNFYLNPFHAYAVLGFFLTTMALGMHAGAILGRTIRIRTRQSRARRLTTSGEITSATRSANLAFTCSGSGSRSTRSIMSDLCILTSGPVVKDWVDFWHFQIPLGFEARGTT